MKITLREVTPDNYEAICDLQVTPEQQQYVATNTWSLVEAAYNDNHICKAIYLDDKPVGFFMWVYETSDKVSIWRFMVSHEWQNKGIGRRAMGLALSQIKLDPGLKHIEICYDPRNPVAENFYTSFGFKEIGMDEDGDDMLAVIEL